MTTSNAVIMLTNFPPLTCIDCVVLHWKKETRNFNTCLWTTCHNVRCATVKGFNHSDVKYPQAYSAPYDSILHAWVFDIREYNESTHADHPDGGGLLFDGRCRFCGFLGHCAVLFSLWLLSLCSALLLCLFQLLFFLHSRPEASRFFAQLALLCDLKAPWHNLNT